MKYLVGLFFLFSATSSNAYLLLGSELANQMKEYDKAEVSSKDTSYYEVGQYIGFVAGVYDAYDLNEIICSGKNVTRGQVYAIVAKYLRNNPERWNEPAFFLVSDALKKAFPCASK